MTRLPGLCCTILHFEEVFQEDFKVRNKTHCVIAILSEASTMVMEIPEEGFLKSVLSKFLEKSIDD